MLRIQYKITHYGENQENLNLNEENAIKYTYTEKKQILELSVKNIEADIIKYFNKNYKFLKK
jgi:uncharacterized ubiquitin-like protein YukD